MLKQKLIQHHVKYQEIHGVDEIKLMTWSEHHKLHNKLRKKGLCNIPSKQLAKISIKAHARTQKNKKYQLDYSRTEKRKNQQKEYDSKAKQDIDFVEKIGKNIYLYEKIRYNLFTKHISYHSRFRTNYRHFLPEEMI